MKKTFLFSLFCFVFPVLLFSQNNPNVDAIVDNINKGVKSNSIVFGAASTYLLADNDHIHATALSSDKFVVVFSYINSSMNGYAVIGTVSSGSTISWGGLHLFNAGQTQQIVVESLNDTTIVIAYRDISNSMKGTAIVGTITNETSISFGSEFVFNLEVTVPSSIIAISSTCFVIGYADFNGYGTSIIGTVDGTDITFGTEDVFHSSSSLYIDLIALSSYKLVVSYRSSTGYSRVGIIDGTSISWGAADQFNDATSYYISSTAINDSKFVVCYQDMGNSSKGTAVVGSVSGTTITFSSENVFNPYNTNNISMIKMDEHHILIAFYEYDGSTKGSSIIGTLWGTTLTWGTIYSYHSGSCWYNVLVKLETGKFAVVYRQKDPYKGNAIIGEIDGVATTWTGENSSDWNLAFNWNTGVVPTIFDNVIIPNTGIMPKIYAASDASCNGLSVEENAILTVESTASGTGSLITDGVINNYGGAIHVQRYIVDDQWHLLTSPITSVTAANFVGHGMQYFDEPSGLWVDITDQTTSLTPVKGYSLWSNSGKASTFTFIGTPNTGDQSIAVTYTDNGTEFKGANLVGNPYPSYIDWNELDDTWGAIYYWNSEADAYVQWNNGLGSGSKYIPPMQAFFVIASSDATFSLSNANRSHTGDDNYYKSTKEVPNGLVLYTNNGAHQDELFIQFNNVSSKGFDLKYDAYKFLSNADGISQLFSIENDIEFSIDVRPEADIIQLGFQNNQNGLYTIGLKENGYMEKLVLEDTKTNTFFDLSHGEYEFLWNITDSKMRFKLHFNATTIEESILPMARIYSFNKTLRISSDITLKDVQLSIYDMMGRLVYEKFFSTLDQETIELNSETGIYLVSVKSQNSITTEKIMIK